MTDDAPTLWVSASELWQMAQALNTLSALLARARARWQARQARDGRMAFSDAEHARRQHEARQHPPLRLMSDDEQFEWQQRIPSALAAQQHGESITVCSAGMVDEAGKPTGEWGVEATVWDGNVPQSKLMVVCRDPRDALALTAHLRETGTPETFHRLHQLAAHAHGEYAYAPLPEPAVATGSGLAQVRHPWVLGEDDWEHALRRAFPPEIADRIVAKHPGHPHHKQWRELHALANAEVARIGADPDNLARLIWQRAKWHEPFDDGPALAHWALREQRTRPGYAERAGAPMQQANAPAVSRRADHPFSENQPIRLLEVRTPQEAVTWANGLEKNNTEHFLEAQLGYGHHGDDVDAILARKFPDLVPRAKAAARKERHQHAVQTGQVAETEGREPVVDPATRQLQLAEVERLDPSAPGDCRVAHAMLGRPVDRNGRPPSDVDRAIAEKFAGVQSIEDKLEILYPGGLPDPDGNAAAWRNRADSDDAVASAERTQPDMANTPQREDIAAGVAAQPTQATAAHERGVAHAVQGTQGPVIRRAIQTVQRNEPAPTRRT